MPAKALASVFAALALAACASTPPLDSAGVREGLTPETVADGGAVFEGERVIWGGRIIETRNEAESSVLEVLGYPLDRGQRPDTDAEARARFLVVRDGFLDPADYAAGRLVTAVGTLGPNRRGSVGEAERVWPVLEAERVELWRESPASARTPAGPRFNFGFGVILGR